MKIRALPEEYKNRRRKEKMAPRAMFAAHNYELASRQETVGHEEKKLSLAAKAAKGTRPHAFCQEKF